ncbi:LLM class flavin-dependent oxidoreductase [Rhodococcus rhodochrous]|uniref:LLM class flavin-dependent oxidoreductase n=1 Tax=Rhodococcus rhodochrous TaxID=1829 RepID=UPI0012FDAA9E|nr:LLM class flavin-dependent oxidoreductase [Rhodococcus rhodochrous]
MDFGIISLFDFYPELQEETSYYEETLKVARDAEALGFDSLWVGEEHFYHFGICANPAVFLAAVARETTRLRLGTSVALTAFDHPLRRAEDFAMLDVISGGRLNLGLGRGGIPRHFEGFGADARESKARYEESLEIIKKAWTEDEFSYDGEIFKFPEISVSPKPIQSPPPIWRGTVSEESFIKAGVNGDNAFVVPWSRGEDEMRRNHALYREALAANGHTEAKTTAVYMMFLDEDHDTAVAEAALHADRYMRLNNSAARKRREGSATFQNAPKSALFELQDRILSVANHIEKVGIVGTPERAIERIHEINEGYGGAIDELVFYPHAGARSPELGLKTMKLFAEQVMPAFKNVTVAQPA